MKKLVLVIFASILFVQPVHAEPSIPEHSEIQWQNWSNGIFEKAEKENKFIILDLEAVWCHWCHVMDQETYSNPDVIRLIKSKYIPVRVDQDSNPELSNRYENYGWPATIVFGPEGNEIVKLRGFISPERMTALLQAIIEDPTPGPSVFPESEIKPAESPYLSELNRMYMKDEHRALYDKEFGGWGQGNNKLIYSDNLEYALVRAQGGDQDEEKMARETLSGALNLLDPEWGGFYQYSDHPNWKSPHFEKIMSIQTQYTRLYALASVMLNNPEYLDPAKRTALYLKNFLMSPEGAFYTSQDADVSEEIDGHKFFPLPDQERKKIGLPRIDKNIYARENGWVINSLATLYDATGNKEYLNLAERAANWIIKNRSLPNGGYRHGNTITESPSLGDSLFMGQAFLKLYESTGNRKWLKHAEDTANFIDKHFKDENAGGFITQIPSENASGVFQKSYRQLDENVALARFTIRLYHYTGEIRYKKMAEQAMIYLASPDLIKNKSFLSGILLADQELASDPVHITVVGPKSDLKSLELFQEALKYPAVYKRIEWFDQSEGPMPNPDVSYPNLPKPAAFACANGTCSLPVFEPQKIAAQVERTTVKVPTRKK